jgi:hypothetical protein
MTKALIPAALTLALAASASAAEHGAPKAEHGAKKEGEGEAKKGKPGTNVDMPFLMAPLTNADGKLTGYAYIASRLTATSEGVVTDVREKLPFIQDALIRDINSEPVTVPDDPEKVDIPGVEKRLLSHAARIMGPGKVKLMTICTVQISELHPSETPALHSPPEMAALPGPLPKNPTKSRCEG